MQNMIIAVFTLMLSVVTTSAAEPVPYGSKDFYPSTERPIGHRADFNGHYPGATPVTEWWEGTPTERPVRMSSGKFFHKLTEEEKASAKTVKMLLPSDDKTKNIVWKMPIPGSSDAHPIVVGDRVIGIAERDYIWCVDANTGKLLWQDRVAPMSCKGLPEAEWRKKQEVCDIARAAGFLLQAFLQGATHLYCIGDPAVAYDWNPDSRPAAITKRLASP